ncbi:MAG: hypothetical protein ACTSU2_04565 [Promethearchaeota archaeon]
MTIAKEPPKMTKELKLDIEKLIKEHIEEFKKILPKLIKENDEIKGAII